MTIFLTAALLLITHNTSAQVSDRIDRVQASAIASFGQRLFLDTNLSRNRTQACATCHDPARAFTDGRAGPLAGAVSLGDDGKSFGDRNTPTISYAALTPVFQRDASGQFSGGFFVDGRASTLQRQVTGPLLDPVEMALPDKAAIVSRVAENPGHAASMKALFGEAVFTSTEHAIRAIVDAIAAFQRSEFFAPFDSKYDRYLRGDYTMTTDEELGRALFFSDLTNCAKCHLKHPHEVSDRETFTNYRYHNIGITINRAARKINGLGSAYRDRGLASNPAVVDMSHNGKFKVPTLRNVAVTGPYMHNGIFKDLHTAVLYYGKFTVNSVASATNPETGERWGDPEFGQTIDFELLRTGQPLDTARARVIVAFLKTLTDARYEHLIE